MKRRGTTASGARSERPGAWRRGWLALALACLLVLSPGLAGAQQTAPVDDAGKAPSLSPRELTERGEALRRRGRFEEAERTFREAVALEPAGLDAQLGLARTARARFAYAEALRVLDGVAARHAGAAPLLAEYGMLYLAVEEPARALRYFESALEIEPANAAAAVGRAACDLVRRDFEAARARLLAYLEKEPENSRARAMLGRVYLEENRGEEAEAELQRALAADELNADALHLLAFVRATQKRPDEVRRLARRALDLDPLNAGARRMLSQYLNGRAGFERPVPAAAGAHIERGLALKRAGRWSAAVGELERALRIEPRAYRALLGLGDLRMRRGDYAGAAGLAERALAIDADGAAGHLILAYAHIGLQEQARTAVGATDFAALFYEQEAPPVWRLTAEIFPDYAALGPRQRLVIDRAVAGLARYLPRLKQLGARHHLLPYDESIKGLGDFEEVAGERTFDGRYYTSVRGVGGATTVSGVEYLDIAARGGFNTIAHEFAHQVHTTAMSGDEKRAIRRLYLQAMREGRVLDYYAAADEYEYFAQGYEAFVSLRKRPATGVTARHTRQELMARDPALYELIRRLSEAPRGGRESVRNARKRPETGAFYRGAGAGRGKKPLT